MHLPKKLTPSTTETLRLLDGRRVSVQKTTPVFKVWHGKKLLDTFGGKPVLKDWGRPCFAELVVYRTFIRAGWSARWIETYGAPPMKPRFLTAWDPRGLVAQKHQPVMDSVILMTLDSIAQMNGNTYSGCWDVVAWYKKTLIFAELKRKAHDRIQISQLMWLKSAFKAGLSEKNFLLVEWSL
jgi:hypothetical protein